jgi:hypothetical protein
MSFLTTANDALERALGVRVLRSEQVNLWKSRAQEAAVTRGEPRRRDIAAERLSDGHAVKAAKPHRAALSASYEPEFVEIWKSVWARTMTGPEKVHGLHHAVRYVVKHGIPGAIMECGVWRGGSMLTVARTLTGLDVHDRELYLFDTFEGMTEPTDRDVHITQKKSAAERLASEGRDTWMWGVASLEDVRKGFQQVSYPTERLHFVPGPVEETVPDQAPERIAILRLDTDWYASTKHELEHLYRRLAPGGVLIIDDYGTWQGAKDATDEFLAATGEPLLLLRTGQGRIAVKPGLASAVGC